MRHVIYHAFRNRMGPTLNAFWTGKGWSDRLDKAKIYHTKRLAKLEKRGNPIPFTQAQVLEVMES